MVADLRFCKSKLEQVLARVPGVGEVEILAVNIPCASGLNRIN